MMSARNKGRKKGMQAVFWLSAAVFCMLLLLYPKESYARELSLLVETVGGQPAIRNKDALKGFLSEQGFYPGYAHEESMEMKNASRGTIYYCLKKPFLQEGDEGLYHALLLQIRDETDQLLYEGKLEDAKTGVRTLAGGKKERLYYCLSLPLSAGNSIAGKTAKLQFSVAVSENKDGLSTDPEEETPDKDGDGSGDGEDGNGNGGTEDGKGDGTEGGTDTENGEQEGNGNSGNQSGGGNSGGSGSGNNGSGGSGNQSSGSGTFGGGGGGSIGKGFYTGSSGSAQVLTTTVSVPDLTRTEGSREGSWVLLDKERNLWKYRLSDNSFLKNGWAFLYNPYHRKQGEYCWYHFDENEYMTLGWLKEEGDKWYYLHEKSDGDLGALMTGWHEDEKDGQTYYLSKETGVMQTGWQSIAGTDGKKDTYFFARIEDTYKQNWFYNTALGRWIYDMLGNRTFGSMYRDEQTPDGSRVDAAGRKL